MIQIDGSAGEGGGQILRTSLAMSILSGRPFTMEKIRAGRANPGLQRQHLTSVIAAAKVSGAKLDGAALGSGSLTFYPGPTRAGEYHFATGSAGSATLVLQTVLPPLLFADGRSQITLEGGTHNSAAPPFDFLQKCFLPLLRRMGADVTLRLERHGFYPRGGGRFVAEIVPVKTLTPLTLHERGKPLRRRCRAVVAGLPTAIADRELQAARAILSWRPEQLETVELPPDQGPGNVVMVEIESENVTEIFTGFGARGVRAEAASEGAAHEAKQYLNGTAPVGEHLADQLLIPLALAGTGSFMTTRPSLHTMTNIDILKRFSDVNFSVRQMDESGWMISAG